MVSARRFPSLLVSALQRMVNPFNESYGSRYSHYFVYGCGGRNRRASTTKLPWPLYGLRRRAVEAKSWHQCIWSLRRSFQPSISQMAILPRCVRATKTSIHCPFVSLQATSIFGETGGLSVDSSANQQHNNSNFASGTRLRYETHERELYRSKIL